MGAHEKGEGRGENWARTKHSPPRARALDFFSPFPFLAPATQASFYRNGAIHSHARSIARAWLKHAHSFDRCVELCEQPFQACAIDEECVKPDGQNSVISFVISKWFLTELSISATG